MSELRPELILEVARLAGLPLKPIGKHEFAVPCPQRALHKHNDSHPSCRLNDEKGVFHCDVCGCGGGMSEFAKMVGIKMQDFPHSKPGATPVLTVSELAAAKALPPEFLVGFGLQNQPRGVLIPYRLANGELAARQRFRTSVVAKEGSRWLRGKGKPVPYGLDRLQGAEAAGYQILAEGESDCWTLWFHGLPGLGIPGANMCGTIQADHVEIVDCIYVVREPDKAGKTFVTGVVRRLREIGWGGTAYQIRFDSTKDVNELHQQNPKEFKARFHEALDHAEPLTPTRKVGSGIDEEEERKPSQADVLVQLVLAQGVELFHDSTGLSWARIAIGDHKEVWRCETKNFKQWLARLFWENNQKVPDPHSLNAALNVIAAKARFEGPERALHNRVAPHEDAIWYDLADPEWRAVRITREGWRIVPDPPILFRRWSHQRAQVEPVRGGAFKKLLDYVNVCESSQQILALVYPISCLVPGIPHPVPVVHGPQGAAKSSLLRVNRRLIDPSVTETLTIPRDARELVQQLAHHWTPYYDNITVLPDWISDSFCRAVTGEGASKRELYTDDDDVIYSFRVCVGLNGINVAIHRPDLLDRSLLFGLELVSRNRRKSEAQFWREFEEARPMLFGAMLDALSRAMRLQPTIQVADLPRMADFTLWGCAIAKALGYSQDDFLAAYHANLAVRNEEVIAANPVAAMVVELMRDRQIWTGTASELLVELETLAGRHRVDMRHRGWPKAAHTLTRRLNEVKPNLAAARIDLNRGRDGQGREVTLRRISENSVTSVTGVQAQSEQEVMDDATCDATDFKASQAASSVTPFESGTPEDGDAGDATSNASAGIDEETEVI